MPPRSGLPKHDHHTLNLLPPSHVSVSWVSKVPVWSAKKNVLSRQDKASLWWSWHAYHLWFSWLQIVCVEAHPSWGFDYTIAETKSNVNTSFASDQARKLNCRKFVLSACIQFARFCFYVSWSTFCPPEGNYQICITQTTVLQYHAVECLGARLLQENLSDLIVFISTTWHLSKF